MIYHRFGSQVEIVGNAGLRYSGRKAQGEPIMLTLVRVKYENGSREHSYQWAETLKADNGFWELDAAIKSAPVLDLTTAELTSAKKEAE